MLPMAINMTDAVKAALTMNLTKVRFACLFSSLISASLFLSCSNAYPAAEIARDSFFSVFSMSFAVHVSGYATDKEFVNRLTVNSIPCPSSTLFAARSTWPTQAAQVMPLTLYLIFFMILSFHKKFTFVLYRIFSPISRKKCK